MLSAPLMHLQGQQSAAGPQFGLPDVLRPARFTDPTTRLRANPGVRAGRSGQAHDFTLGPPPAGGGRARDAHRAPTGGLAGKNNRSVSRGARLALPRSHKKLAPSNEKGKAKVLARSAIHLLGCLDPPSPIQGKSTPFEPRPVLSHNAVPPEGLGDPGLDIGPVLSALAPGRLMHLPEMSDMREQLLKERERDVDKRERLLQEKEKAFHQMKGSSQQGLPRSRLPPPENRKAAAGQSRRSNSRPRGGPAILQRTKARSPALLALHGEPRYVAAAERMAAGAPGGVIQVQCSEGCSSTNSSGSDQDDSTYFEDMRVVDPAAHARREPHLRALRETVDVDGPIMGLPKNWRVGKNIGKGAEAEVFLLRAPKGQRQTGKSAGNIAAAVPVVHFRKQPVPSMPSNWCVKVFKLDMHVMSDRLARAVRKLQRDVNLMRNLQHANIVQYHGAELRHDALYVFLEYVDGGSVLSQYRRHGPFSENLLRSYTKQLVEGLHYLHSNRIMHRDIKGANVLLSTAGDVKLADFGHAKQQPVVDSDSVNSDINSLETNSDAGACSSLKGTVFWMAPEVLKNTAADSQLFWPAADIWSLGATVVEMASGQVPWGQREQETTMGAMWRIANSNSIPQLPSHLSPLAKHFILQCLARDPAERSTTAELLQHPFLRGSCCFPALPPSSNGLDPEQASSPTTDFESKRYHGKRELELMPKEQFLFGPNDTHRQKDSVVTAMGPRPVLVYARDRECGASHIVSVLFSKVQFSKQKVVEWWRVNHERFEVHAACEDALPMVAHRKAQTNDQLP